MTDIVKQLLAVDSTLDIGPVMRICHEAADEIERLREELKSFRTRKQLAEAMGDDRHC